MEKRPVKTLVNVLNVVHVSMPALTVLSNIAHANNKILFFFTLCNNKKLFDDRMKTEDVEIRLVTSWPEDDIVMLYKAGGWWKDSYDKAGLPQLIAGSYAFAVALDVSKGKTIGMGRVLSDGVSDAYIQDCIILPEYRGHTIGTRLVQTLLHYCLSQGLTWIGLIAEPKSDEFYCTLGFKKMKNYVPMLYSMEK